MEMIEWLKLSPAVVPLSGLISRLQEAQAHRQNHSRSWIGPGTSLCQDAPLTYFHVVCLWGLFVTRGQTFLKLATITYLCRSEPVLGVIFGVTAESELTALFLSQVFYLAMDHTDFYMNDHLNGFNWT